MKNYFITVIVAGVFLWFSSLFPSGAYYRGEYIEKDLSFVFILFVLYVIGYPIYHLIKK